jgi:hypothetical protein
MFSQIVRLKLAMSKQTLFDCVQYRTINMKTYARIIAAVDINFP